MKNTILKIGDPSQLSISAQFEAEGSAYEIHVSHDYNVSCITSLSVRREKDGHVDEKSLKDERLSPGATVDALDFEMMPEIRLSNKMYAFSMPHCLKVGSFSRKLTEQEIQTLQFFVNRMFQV